MPYSRLNARTLFCTRGENDTLAMALRFEQSEEKLHHAKVINVLVYFFSGSHSCLGIGDQC